MIRSPHFINYLILFIYCWHSVAASTGTLAKEFCRRDSLDSEGDAQAVITAVFPIREATMIGQRENQQGDRLRSSKRSNMEHKRKSNDGNLPQEFAGQPRKACGAVTQQGAQLLLAVDWVISILNVNSENVFGVDVNDSYIPGVKLGYRVYDTCGLEKVPVSQLIEAYSDFYAPTKTCVSNSSTIHAGAIMGEMEPEDLLDAASYMKRYAQPVMTQSTMPEAIADKTQYGNIFSTLPSIGSKAQAMVRLARQIGFTRLSLVFEDNTYGSEGKERLLKMAKENEVCISNFYKIPTISNGGASFSTIRSQLETVIKQLVGGLPHAPVVFLFAAESTSVEFLQAAMNSTSISQVSQLRWILSDFIRESSRFAGMYSARGLLAIAPDSPSDVAEFREYWRNTIVEGFNNVWLKEYYQQTVGCRIPGELGSHLASFPVCREGTMFALGEADPDIVINPYVLSVIDSVYAFAKSMRRAWEIKCRGRPGVCQQLMQMSREEYLEVVRNMEFKYDSGLRSPPSLIGRNVTFRAPNSGSLAVYELVEKDGQLLFMEVFLYHNDRLQQTGQPLFYYSDGSVSTEPPPITCAGKPDSGVCSCVNSDHQPKSRPIYKPGDVYLVGMFPIHSSSEENGISCGSIRHRDGYQLAEAFWYALEKVNDKRSPAFSSVLRGVRLGSIALDSCNSPPRASHLASGLIIDSKLELESKEIKSVGSAIIQNRDIVGVIGDFGDQTSGELASVLRFAGLTQLSYGAKSAVLGDAFAYPTFLRTVVSDNTRLNMTFSSLRQLGWDYVQVVLSDSYYGRTMAKVFHTLAAEAGICVAQNVILSSNSSNAVEIIEALNRKPNANAIVVFVEKKPLRVLLEQLQQFYSSSGRRFVLIAPDYWYNDQDLLKGVESAAEGSLAFAARKLANQHFQKYITSRTIIEGENNPWLMEYLESSLQCNFPGSGSHHYSTSCNPGATLGHIPGFRSDLAVTDVTNAVYAFVFGLDAMLKDYCGKDYHGICETFKVLPNRNELLFDYVREAKFEDETGRVFSFSENRDAATPVAVLHVRKSSDITGGLQYAQAGLYSASESDKSSFLQAVSVRALRSRVTSACLTNGAFYCSECRRLTTRSISSGDDDQEQSTPSSPFTTMPTEPRSRNDRNSIATHLPKKEYYTKEFLYAPSNDKMLIGAVFPVRGRLSPSSPFQCGHLTEEGVFMAEALLWAMDAMNANADVVRFQLGAVVFDSCSNAGQVFDNLKDLYTRPPGYFITNATEPLDPEDIVTFINDPTTDGSTSLAIDLLSSLNVTNFAVTSITSEQSAGSPYSLHTTMPVVIQDVALLSFLERTNWTYVSIIYSNQRWAVQAYFRFKSEALERGICFGAELSIRADESNSQMDKVVSILRSKTFDDESGGARAVILLLDIKETSVFLRAVARSMATGNLDSRFIFVGAATWGDRVPFKDGEEQVALGSVVFQHDSQPVDVFRTYVESLRYDNNDRNPWWREFFQRKFNCDNDHDCSKHSMSEVEFRNEAIYTNIMNAVWASSVGLNSLCATGFKRRQQQQQQQNCRGIQKSKNFRTRFLDSVRNAGFARVDNGQEPFRFTKNGWSDSGVYLLNLVQDEAGGLEYKAVGRFTEKNGLTFTESMFGYDKNNAKVPLNELKSKCTDLTKCSQCASKVAKMQRAGTTSTVGLSTDQPSPSSGSVPTYGVLLSNTTYNDTFLYLPGAADSFLVAATFPIHARGAQPLSCGRIRPEHYQDLQGFLWAMKILHADNAVLHGTKLGVLVFDTCSDPTKAVRDLSNFLSDQVSFQAANGEKIDPKRTLAILNSPYTSEALPIAELLSEYGVPNVSPGMSASLFTLAGTYKTGMSLRTSVPTDVQARAMASLLSRIGWNAVSLLFTDNVWGANGHSDFRMEADQRDICIVISEPVPESDGSYCAEFAPKVDETLARLLAVKAATGVRAVVVWLTEDSLRCLLHGVKRAINRGAMKSGDLNFILSAEIADLQSTVIEEFERETLGFVALQYAAATVEPFREYWQLLPASDDVAGHAWSKEYYERTMQQQSNLIFRQNAYLLNTVNAVFSIAVGLEQLRRNLCGTEQETSGLCQAMTKDPQLRLKLLDSVRKVEFDDATGKRFQFAERGFGNQGLAILNLVRKDKWTELREIGSYETDGLKLKLPPQGFDESSQSTFNLRDQPSTCSIGESRICAICTYGRKNASISGADNADPSVGAIPSFDPNTTTGSDGSQGAVDLWNSLMEQQQRNRNPTPSPMIAEAAKQYAPFPSAPSTPTSSVGSSRLAKDMVVLPPSRRFTIMGLFPVHKRGQTPLSCEGFNSMTGFQQLAAFLYAVNEINRDQHFLPDMNLGAVAIDDCNSEERALADVFEFLSAPESQANANDLVAAVGFSFGNGGTNAEKFFRSLNVPIVSSGATPFGLRNDAMTLGAVPSDEIYAKIVSDVFQQMKWSYFSVLYESGFESTARHFERILTASRFGCLARSTILSPDASLEDTKFAVRQLVLATGSKAVAVFLSDRNTLQLLKAVVAERVPVGRFIFLTKFNDDWIQDADFLVPLQRFGQGLLTVELQRRNSTNFANYLSSLTLASHAPFPTAWFEQFWQQTFQCVLPQASSTSQQFSTPCTGDERLTADGFVQGATVLPTILAVQSVARGLHRFLSHHCPSRTVDSLESCLAASSQNSDGPDPKVQLMKSIRGTNFTYVHELSKEPVVVNFGSSNYLEAEYTIRNFIRQSDEDFQAQEVGVWRPATGLILDNSQIAMTDALGDKKVPVSTCSGEPCTAQCAALFSASLASMNSSIFAQDSRAPPGQVPSASLYFHSIWGIVVAAVAALGMLTCVVCIIYFLVTFPISHGSTVLGYTILFGLIVLYALAFAYVVAPTSFSCSIRRFCTGICWTFVFAPMFIKVIYAWQTRSVLTKPPIRSDNGISPCTLFTLTLGVVFVQIVIAVEWVVLQKPDGVVYVTNFQGGALSSSLGGVWRCSPGDQFEIMIVISTVYVMLVIFLTTVFSLLTWNVDEQNRESRWIFLACLLSIAIWIIWTALATKLEYKMRDPAVAIGIVVNATVILLCLYLRKAILYSKYRREAKEVMFETHSAVYLTSTLASGGQLMVETNGGGGGYYDGKTIVPTNGNHYAGVSQGSVNTEVASTAQRRPVLAAATLMNGRRSTGEERTVFYSNSVFEGNGGVGSEFNPGARHSSSNGFSLYNGKRNGSLAPSTPTNHRF